MIQNVASARYCPTIAKDANTKRLIDFSALKITQFEALAETIVYQTVNEAAENFYMQKASMQNLKQKRYNNTI